MDLLKQRSHGAFAWLADAGNWSNTRAETSAACPSVVTTLLIWTSHPDVFPASGIIIMGTLLGVDHALAPPTGRQARLGGPPKD